MHIASPVLGMGLDRMRWDEMGDGMGWNGRWMGMGWDVRWDVIGLDRVGGGMRLEMNGMGDWIG